MHGLANIGFCLFQLKPVLHQSPYRAFERIPFHVTLQFFSINTFPPQTANPHPPSLFRSTYLSMLYLNPLNTKLNPILHLLALLGAHPILHVSRVRVKYPFKVRILSLVSKARVIYQHT
jgi:hypothetical protein